MVVDDHPLYREGVVHAFRSSDRFEVVGEGGTAADAVRLVADNDPDLLLLDEATASLDAASTAMFAQVVRDAREVQDLGVLTVGHDRELFEAWCDEVADLRRLS